MYLICSTKTSKIVHTDVNFIPNGNTISEYEDCVKKLNGQKREIDYYASNGLKKIYEEARNNQFPENKDFKINKGGLKLYDIIKEFPELGVHKDFLDVCGGPGGWSKVLLDLGMSGYGITILSDSCKMWYNELETNEKFSILHYNNNDITDKHVKEYCINTVKNVSFVVADGAPSIDIVGEECNQEDYSCKIIYSEVYIALSVLNTGGSFIFKIFDTFKSHSQHLIYLLSVVFKKVYIYKPPNSRIVNSEKYVICLHKYAKATAIIPLFKIIFDQWIDGHVPDNLIPPHIINLDNKFKSHFNKFVTDYTNQQIEALGKVMDTLQEMLYPPDIYIPQQTNKGSIMKKGGKGKGKFEPVYGKGYGDTKCGKGVTDYQHDYGDIKWRKGVTDYQHDYGDTKWGKGVTDYQQWVYSKNHPYNQHKGKYGKYM